MARASGGLVRPLMQMMARQAVPAAGAGVAAEAAASARTLMPTPAANAAAAAACTTSASASGVLRWQQWHQHQQGRGLSTSAPPPTEEALVRQGGGRPEQRREGGERAGAQQQQHEQHQQQQQQQGASQPSDSEWTEVVDEATGQTYFWNESTGETTELGEPRPKARFRDSTFRGAGDARFQEGWREPPDQDMTYKYSLLGIFIGIGAGWATQFLH